MQDRVQYRVNLQVRWEIRDPRVSDRDKQQRTPEQFSTSKSDIKAAQKI